MVLLGRRGIFECDVCGAPQGSQIGIAAITALCPTFGFGLRFVKRIDSSFFIKLARKMEGGI